ncbi:MAG: HupE/UreJ family protein [Verrucomicrobiae bacterium]|nr:HupE/UreJ family protein [Verrucomicrobiae bacterium]
MIRHFRPRPGWVPAACLLAALCVPMVAMAHPGHGATPGMADGFLHPFTGLDHALALLGAGLWAAQAGGRARWAIPGVFLLMLIAGATGVRSVGGFPGPEPLVLASVFVLGGAVLVARRAPLGVALMLTAIFAAAHGAAHGTSVAGGEVAVGHAVGLLLASACLLGVGVASGSWAIRIQREPWLRWAGAGIVAGGLFCLA